MPLPTEVIIWDFDGTIADTQRVILNTFIQVFAERALGPVDPSTVRALIGIPPASTFGHLSPAARDDVELRTSLVADYRRIFARRAPTEAQIFPGVIDVVDRVANAGVTQVIATGRGRSSLDDLLGRFALADRFSALVTPEDVTHAKPDPEMVEVALARVGVDPANSLVIGDTTYDIEMGRRAGARTCGVTWGNQDAAQLAGAGADHIVESVDELATLLE